MVPIVCLRLAFGMIASLLVLDPRPIPPRFFRVQFLVSLTLLGIAGYFLVGMQFARDGSRGPIVTLTDMWYRLGEVFVCVSAGLCFIGCVVWHLENAPLGGLSVVLSAIALGFSLFFFTPWDQSALVNWHLELPYLDWRRLADSFASAAVIGTATSAMLLGHSYLISPAMTIIPLRRMLWAGTAALAIRVTLACWALWFWTAEHPLGNLDRETLLWLSARWLLGILAPLVLGWMAWETARIRSTQSATGILYVVVIVTFLGELTSLLLLQKTGYPL